MSTNSLNRDRKISFCEADKIAEFNWKHPYPLPIDEWMAQFEEHIERPSKDGRCFVPGVIEQTFGKRQCLNEAISRIDALIYDIDRNQTPEAVLALAPTWGLTGIIYTTHSHKTTTTELDADQVMAWVGKTFAGITEPEQLTREHIEAYLRAKNRAHLLTPGFDFPAQFDPNNGRYYSSRNEENKAVIVVHHDPIDKFRVVFPLAQPIIIDKLAFGSKERIAKFKQIYESVGLALGLNFDPACTDPSHRYYMPSHKPGAEYLTQRFDGDLLDWKDEERFPRVSEQKSTKSSPGGRGGAKTDYKAVLDRDGKVIDLYGTCVEGFDVESLLAECLPDEMIRTDRSNGSGFHVGCAFESEHTKEGGNGAFCSNGDNGQWTIYCCHTCKERHGDRLAYLAEYIRAGHITVEDIERAMPEKPDFKALIEEALEALAAVDKTKEPELWSQKKLVVFDLITDSDLSTDAQDAWLHKVCAAIKAKATACNTDLKPDFKRYRKEKHKEKMSAKRARRAEASSENPGKQTFLNHQQSPFTVVAERLLAAFTRANTDDPRIFNVGIGLVRTEQNPEKGRIEAQACTKDVFGHELNKVADFCWTDDDPAKWKHDSVPEKFVKHLFNAPPEVQRLPFLKSIAYSPTFAADGTLINEPGYYPESGHLYAPPASMAPVPEVPTVPSRAIVAIAVALLMEAFWDFPFNDGEEVPLEWFATDDPAVKLSIGKASRANTIAKLLLFFAREMISGNKPLFAVDKPTSRIGSQLMAKVVNLITSGDVPPNVQVPANDDEWVKTALTYLLSRVGYIVFDNVVYTVKGAMLASMLTGKISGRMLGLNKDVEGVWNATTEVNGINLVFDREIAERTIYTLLDPRMKDPTKRIGYRHANLEDWVKEHRSRLIWACLVIIQNWIAKGKPEMDDPARILAGFEPYCRIMGGILDAAGIEGFNSNRALIRIDSKHNDLDAFVQEWFEVFGTETVVPGHLDDYEPRSLQRRANGGATSLAMLLLDMSDECELGLFTGNGKLGSLGARLSKNVLSKALGVCECDGAEYVLERDGRGYCLKPQRGAPERSRWDTANVRPGFEHVKRH